MDTESFTEKSSCIRTGLVMEGGAMRGMFTTGVYDVWLENGITFDGAVGVSAGAAFGCNFKSKQIGRPLRYNKRFCNDKRYASWESWFKTGDLYNAEFCYHQIPDILDPFDAKTFSENPMKFYITATNVKTGKGVYHLAQTGQDEDVQWFRASASMPIVSKIVKIRDFELLDGGVADSIPLRFMEYKGYNRNVVLLTQPLDFVKKPNKFIPLVRKMYRKYPEFVHAFETRHTRYNRTLEYIKEQEMRGTCLAIRPPKALEIGSTEKNPAELDRVYQIGRQTGLDTLEEVRKFLNR